MSVFNANLFQHINVPAQESPSSDSYSQRVTVLPLNLIALIISHLGNVADLARVCQTSRVLYYMTLPQLYKNITLVSYNIIRYKNDKPEGQGSASPFSMGLNALVTRNMSSLVRTLSLEGEWREHDLQEFARVGRVPDDSMMLNIAVRAAVDKCTQLESFKWDLSTKLLDTVYNGLAGLPHLQSLHLRCPADRLPRPSITIPPIKNLRKLVLTHYDPLCFPDDVSLLLSHAQWLDTLVMHFSPRMRDASEPSVQLNSFFRRNIASKRLLKLKTLQLYNLFALADTAEMEQAVDVSVIENLTFLNTFGQDEDISPNHTGSERVGAGYSAFIDHSWRELPKSTNTKRKFERYDRLSKAHVKNLTSITGLERLYMVNSRHNVAITNGTPNHSDPSPGMSITPPSTSTCSSNSNNSRPTPPLNTSLRDMYLDAICTNHGATLRHLIFPSRWPLPARNAAQLIRACPNLTQLSMGMDLSGFPQLRLLMPFLKKLWAVRVVRPPQQGGGEGGGQLEEMECAMQEGVMSRELASEGDFPELKYVGVGEWVWEVGGVYEEVVQVNVDAWGGGEMKEELVRKRRLKKIALEDVWDVEIWRMDSQDVVV